ncbi:MAG TPA: hypothetical protein VMR75_03815 [Candidatus Saccharimonadales bacterium]|nr:hypothetical protein [Candidatus Saccharimonadales bacterium]
MTRLKSVVWQTLKSLLVYSFAATLTELSTETHAIRTQQLTPEDGLRIPRIDPLFGGGLALATYHLRKWRRNRQRCQTDGL